MARFSQMRWRYGIVTAIQALIPLWAVLAALIVGGFLIAAIGANPFHAYRALVIGAFGSVYGLSETVARTCPLLFAALGTAICFRAKVYNIGAEGQLYIGALMATVTALWIGDALGPFSILLVIVGGFLGGAVWGGIAGFLKARWGANEIITTIMFNYIAIYVAGFFVNGPLRDPEGAFPWTPIFATHAQLPRLLAGTRLHAGVLVALAASFVVFLLLRKMVIGYEIRVVGEGERVARYGRIPVERIIVGAMILGGGFAGLAGMNEVAGIHHRMLEHISPGFGYTAIAVALLGELHPMKIILAAFLFGALEIGSSAMQYEAKVPAAMVLVIEGLIVIFVVGRAFLTRRLPRLQPLSGK
ncbi:MAG: ABC transporter permease [Nitrospinota bacterium]|jgi:simple sugar transport system permease protein|nr:ABC transporter permease [Nitrospinota bacterium]